MADSMADSDAKWRTQDWEPRNPRVDAFLAKLDGPRRVVVADLRARIHAVAPDVRESIYWGVPFFFRKGPFCYLSPAKKHVTFGFMRGSHIADPSGRLTSTGKTTVAKAVLKYDADPDAHAIDGWLREAVRLDDAGADEEC